MVLSRERKACRFSANKDKQFSRNLRGLDLHGRAKRGGAQLGSNHRCELVRKSQREW